MWVIQKYDNYYENSRKKSWLLIFLLLFCRIRKKMLLFSLSLHLFESVSPRLAYLLQICTENIKWMPFNTNCWSRTLSRPRGQRECCTERGRKAGTLSLPWKARKPLFFYSSSHPCFALYLFSFTSLSVLFSMEHLGPKTCHCCGHTHTHTHTRTRTHLGLRAPTERRQVHPKGLANSNTGGAKSHCAPRSAQKLLTPQSFWRQTPKVQFDKMFFVHSLFVTLFCLSFSCFTALFVCFFQARVEWPWVLWRQLCCRAPHWNNTSSAQWLTSAL